MKKSMMPLPFQLTLLAVGLPIAYSAAVLESARDSIVMDRVSMVFRTAIGAVGLALIIRGLGWTISWHAEPHPGSLSIQHRFLGCFILSSATAIGISARRVVRPAPFARSYVEWIVSFAIAGRREPKTQNLSDSDFNRLLIICENANVRVERHKIG